MEISIFEAVQNSEFRKRIKPSNVELDSGTGVIRLY